MISLYKHNQEGYENLEKMLEEAQCAAINHATGTGKSFILLKYLDNNKEKKYLYIAPTYEIINQLIERDMKKAEINKNDLSIDSMIYRTLLNCDINTLYNNYDVFILDEYHRAGAKETYKQIKKLKELINNGNENKKIIGLTATPIRYLDKERNMTQEIFDGNIASNIPLEEAIIEGILPIPQYIIRSSSIENEYQKTKRRIGELYPSSIKEKYKNEFQSIGENALIENNITNIFRNNIKPDGKYIFFSSTIDNLKKSIQNVNTWFEDFPNIKIYEVHSKISKEEQTRLIKEFEESKDGLNIIFVVDLFSEGVHPKNVDGVILNRQTTSPIIYFQQIGRTLTSSNINNTVQIIDLKSNYVSHDAIKRLYSDIIKLSEEKIKENPEKKEKYLAIIEAFKIIDISTKYIEKIIRIRQEITRETILKSKIEYIINRLEEYIKENNIKELSGINITDKNIKRLYYRLYEYKDYLTEEDIKHLNELSIIMPTSRDITIEEIVKQKIDDFIDKIVLYKQINNITTEIIAGYNLNNELRDLYNEIIYYAKYISIDDMIRLQELNILLPNYLMVTKEERERHLKGYSNERELEIEERRKIKIRILEYLKTNIIEEDNELFPYYIELLESKSKTIKNQIKEIINIKELPIWNKLLLDIEISKEEQLHFYQTCLINYKTNNYLPYYIKLSINKLYEKYRIGKELLDIINSKDNNKNQLNEIITYINNYNNTNNILEDQTYQDMYKELSTDNKRIISSYLKKIIQERNKNIINNLISKQNMQDTIILIKSCDIDNLNLLKEKLEEQINKINMLLEYINLKVKGETDKLYIFKDILDEEELSFLINNDIRKLKLSISKQLTDLKIKLGLCDYVLFCLTNKRRPVSSYDEDEIELFNKFNGIRKKLSKKNFNLINDYLNTNEIIKGTEEQIVLNANHSVLKKN